MKSTDATTDLQQQVLHAIGGKMPLHIRGGGSKDFLGHNTSGQSLATGTHRGIVDYDPRELVLTARSGTPLVEIERALSESGQMLAFEPPHFGAQATLGGTIACGLSGPRRPYAGSARDFMLGCRLLNGKGELLRFGGQVMKNVAGYDISRLMAGAYGTLGVLLEISLKVLPKPPATLTLVHECKPSESLDEMATLRNRPLPVDASCYHGNRLYVRLSGSEQAVREARSRIPGDLLPDADTFWHDLREQRLPYFQHHGPLYRIAVKPASDMLRIPGNWLLDWGGAQRWLYSNETPASIRHQAEPVGGHVTLFRHAGQDDRVFQPMPSGLMQLHQRIKDTFDPHHLFNQGRMYPEI